MVESRCGLTSAENGFYKSNGYKYQEYKIIPVENDENLCYLEMIKEIL